MAHAAGVSAYTVAKAWRDYGIKPWRCESFRFSTDPELVGKVIDIVRPVPGPPENAIVLCVDEKSQIQALDRTMPVLPMQPGLIERRSHDYLRHGTTTLFAALEIATGKVTAAVKPRHRNTEFLAFLKQLERTYRRRGRRGRPPVQLHLVMDNYAAHKHQNVKAWLAANPRFVVHFTPTHASWMNLVEVWFSMIERQAIHRGVFSSVKDLNAKIRAYIDGWNDRCHPFVWTKTAEEILKKANRKKLQMRGTSPPARRQGAMLKLLRKTLSGRAPASPRAAGPGSPGDRSARRLQAGRWRRSRGRSRHRGRGTPRTAAAAPAPRRRGCPRVPKRPPSTKASTLRWAKAVASAATRFDRPAQLADEHHPLRGATRVVAVDRVHDLVVDALHEGARRHRPDPRWRVGLLEHVGVRLLVDLRHPHRAE